MTDHAALAHDAQRRGNWEEVRVALLHGAGIEVRVPGPPLARWVEPELAAFAQTRLSDMMSPVFTAAWGVLVLYGVEPESLHPAVLARLDRDLLVASDLAGLAQRDHRLQSAVIALLPHASPRSRVALATRLAERLAGAEIAIDPTTCALLADIARQAGRVDGRELRYWLAQVR